MDKWGRFRDNEIILIRGGEEVKKGNLIEEILCVDRDILSMKL